MEWNKHESESHLLPQEPQLSLSVRSVQVPLQQVASQQEPPQQEPLPQSASDWHPRLAQPESPERTLLGDVLREMVMNATTIEDAEMRLRRLVEGEAKLMFRRYGAGRRTP